MSKSGRPTIGGYIVTHSSGVLCQHLFARFRRSLQNALEKRSKETGDPVFALVVSVLSRCLGVPHHALFQVSTSGVLVQSV